MYQKFKQYFEVSQKEFRGMMVFIVLLLLFFVSPYVYEKLTFEPVKVTIQTLKPKIEEIESFNQNEAYSNDKESVDLESAKAILFNFNPNDLPLEDWVKLGLSEKQARSIKNYEAKGGQFRTIADVKKMYAISSQQFLKLEPYVQIPEEIKSPSSFAKSEKQGETFSKQGPEKINVDINSADSSMLTSIRGIGPSFAARIIKYRTRLGGFYSKAQLREVYGIDSAKYDQIVDQFKVEPQMLKMININECTFEELKQFPYLSFKQMNVIIAYRKQHGNYNSIDDLNKIAILTPEIIQKIAPYFSF